MAKTKRRPDLLDRICDAVKELTAHRQTRTYAAQWISVHEVAQRLGLPDDDLEEAIQAGVVGHRLVVNSGPLLHSISLIYGWGEG